MIRTAPVSRARDLNSSSSPARTVRSRQLLLDDLQPLGDLLLVGGGAVAAEQELADIGRHRVLAAELPHEVLAHDKTRERFGGLAVQIVKFHAQPPTTVALLATSRSLRVTQGQQHRRPISTSSATKRLVRPSASS